jgi:hypothetical protein
MSNTNCSIQINVGDLKELISVELPCFVKSSKTAIEMLGGDAALQSAFDNNTSSCSLQFRFPTKDQTRHNIQGCPIGRQGVLIKIRRKKTDPDNMSVEVLGCVNKTFLFNNPADYQVFSRGSLVLIMMLTCLNFSFYLCQLMLHSTQVAVTFPPNPHWRLSRSLFVVRKTQRVFSI